MPDRAKLAEREQLETLRRSSRAAGVDPAVPVADEAALVREAALASPASASPGAARSGVAGMPRGMSPAMLMSMQRFAGNRATVQAVGLFQKTTPSGKKLDEEEPLAEDAGPGAETKPQKETSAAAGPPDSGGSAGGSGPPAGGGAGGGAAGGAAGGAGSPGSPGTSGIGKSGEEPTTKPPSLEPEASGIGKSGNEPPTKPDALAGSGKSGKEPPAKPSAIGGLAGATTGAGETKSGKEPATKPGEAPKPADGAGATPGTTGSGPKPGPAAGLKPGAKPGAGGGGPAPGGGDQAVPPGPAGPTGPSTPATVPAGPHGLPDPETAKSGIDWNQILSDYGPPVRTALEVGRLIPGWGLLAGLGADALNFQSDLASIPNSENADLATGLIVFRNFVNIGNNVVGHILYVDQLIQDGLAGSVVGAEFTPLTAAANDVLSVVKVGLDEVQMGTDIVIEVEALYESGHAPTSAEAEQWKQLADGYAANLMGDVVNITLDVISLASLGASNTGAVQQAREPMSLAGAFMKSAVPNIIGGINGVLGVWLGNLITAGRHAYDGTPTELREKALVYDMAGGFVENEAGQARMTYTAVDAVIGAFEAYADQQSRAAQRDHRGADRRQDGVPVDPGRRPVRPRGHAEEAHDGRAAGVDGVECPDQRRGDLRGLRLDPGGPRRSRDSQLQPSRGGARGQRRCQRHRVPRQPGHGDRQRAHQAQCRERPVTPRWDQGRGPRSGAGGAGQGRQPGRMAGAACHRERSHGRHAQQLHRQVQRRAREVHQRRAGDGPDHR